MSLEVNEIECINTCLFEHAMDYQIPLHTYPEPTRVPFYDGLYEKSYADIPSVESLVQVELDRIRKLVESHFFDKDRIVIAEIFAGNCSRLATIAEYLRDHHYSIYVKCVFRGLDILPLSSDAIRDSEYINNMNNVSYEVFDVFKDSSVKDKFDIVFDSVQMASINNLSLTQFVDLIKNLRKSMLPGSVFYFKTFPAINNADVRVVRIKEFRQNRAGKSYVVSDYACDAIYGEESKLCLVRIVQTSGKRISEVLFSSGVSNYTHSPEVHKFLMELEGFKRIDKINVNHRPVATIQYFICDEA